MPGGFQTCAVSKSIASIENSRTAKKETDGPAGVVPAPWAQPFRPGSAARSSFPPQLLTGHWKVSCVAGARQGQRLDYLQGQGRLTRPPRDGSLRIHPSPGPSGRTAGTESLVLVGCLLPDGSPSTSEQHWYGRRSGSCPARAQFDSSVVGHGPAPALVRSV